MNITISKDLEKCYKNIEKIESQLEELFIKKEELYAEKSKLESEAIMTMLNTNNLTLKEFVERGGV